jgi:hypothetical protein
MQKKTITQAVLDAAKMNAKKSTGPRTDPGKRRAGRNAITHGFFSRELALNDEEKPEFEAVSRSLRSQLVPKTPLQKVGFEEILSCAARCKKALRMEMRRVNRTLDVRSRSGVNLIWLTQRAPNGACLAGKGCAMAYACSNLIGHRTKLILFLATIPRRVAIFIAQWTGSRS